MSSSTIVSRAYVICSTDVHGSNAYLFSCVPLVKCSSYGDGGYGRLGSRVAWLHAARLRHRSGLRQGVVRQYLASVWACVAAVSSDGIQSAQHNCCHCGLLLLAAVAGCLPMSRRRAAELSVHYDSLTSACCTSMRCIL
jgi:hypothetical protein